MFILLLGLFEIIAQSADGSAKIFFVNLCGGCQEMDVLWHFALWGIF